MVLKAGCLDKVGAQGGGGTEIQGSRYLGPHLGVKTLLWEGRDKEIQAGKKLIAAKNSMKYIIVTDKFKSLKRYVQWEFNFIPTDR